MNSEAFIAWVNAFPGDFKRPLIMGILNVTEDSFSDGGCFIDPFSAVAHAEQMIREGADLIDIGGESTRPGANEVSLQTELDRVIPVISELRARSDIALSIDTYKPEVMTAAIQAGATMINDVRALQMPGAIELVAALQVPVCLMHSKGTSNIMQDDPNYPFGVMDELALFFESRLKACTEHGIAFNQILLDPGFGFGKRDQHNLELTKKLEDFGVYQRPMVYGASRKSSIGRLLNCAVDQRLFGSLGLAACAVFHGASMVRVHDVLATKQLLDMIYLVEKEC